jgi:hypothetical protein
LEQRQALVLPVVHRTLSGVNQTLFGAQAEHIHELAALGFFQSRSAIIHRTVWCAPDIFGEPTEQRSTAPNGRLRCQMNSEHCASQKSERTGLSSVARGQRTSTINRSKPQRLADVTRTEQ